jgi:hypothetical protein
LSTGVCTNGTRNTPQIGAKFTVRFRGEGFAPMYHSANFFAGKAHGWRQIRPETGEHHG